MLLNAQTTNEHEDELQVLLKQIPPSIELLQ